MPPLINPKHEMIALSLSKGASAAQAYFDAYRPQRREHAASAAYRLMQNERHGKLIRARVEELRGLKNAKEKQVLELADDSPPTKNWVLVQLKRIYTLSLAEGSLGTANRALELIGKELGLFRDKPNEKAIDLDHMTLDQIEGIIKQLENDPDVVKAAETLEKENDQDQQA